MQFPETVDVRGLHFFPQSVINDMIYMGLMTNAYEKGTKQLDKNSRIIRDRAYEQ